MLLVAIGCASNPERHYFAGRLDDAIAGAEGPPKAKYLAMQAFVSGGDYSAAIDTAERAYSSTDDPVMQADALTWEGFARYAQAMTSGSDDYRVAKDRIERALTLRQRIGEPRGIAEATFYRGLVEERLGNKDDALQLYRRALEIARDRFALEESYAERHIAFIERDRGDLAAARHRLQRSLQLRERIGFRVFLPFSVLSLAEIDTALERYEVADREFARSRDLAKGLAFRRLEVLVDLGWSELREKQKRIDDADEMLQRALKTSQEIGYARGVQLATSRIAALRR